MSTFKNKLLLRWIAILASFCIVSLILWNTYTFFQKFKIEERSKMEVLGRAYERFARADLDDDVELERFIQGSNNSIPMIITDGNDNITLWRNLNITDTLAYKDLELSNQVALRRQLEQMKSYNEPINFSYGLGDTKIVQYIYYSNSDLLNKLKYYPLALILILVLFSFVIILFFKSSKIADQNKLWTGMAKETAHQIGTPLSSLMGWIELLKLEQIDQNTILEIEKDVDRLNIITERFSKIGSIPTLQKENLTLVVKNAFQYLESRSSKQIKFSFTSEEDHFWVLLNTQLFGWVIENLIKNAIDAMQGKGMLSIELEKHPKHIAVLITDSGKGIPKKLWQQIFNPGFTTKKRGWGLGLSLSKRIVEEYHSGKIFVKKSEQGQGATFCIQIKNQLPPI